MKKENIDKITDSLFRLSCEHDLKNYFTAIQETNKNLSIYKDIVISRLRYIVQTIFNPNIDILIYGSQANGLNLKISDIDILIVGFETDNR